MDDKFRAPTDALTPSEGEPLPLQIVVASGPDFGKWLKLEKGTYRIGKDPDNEMVLSDGAVSRTHLMVEVLPHGARIKDTGSKNGSYCNGLRFTAFEAKTGTVIRIGRTDLQLVPAGAPVPAFPPSDQIRFGGLVGSSLAMRRLYAVLERIAPTDADVLLHGETGTGKELCAEAIHASSRRARGPFVVCDLASVTPSLFESELFGHVKGSFTGATTDREGAFERADGGTVFLDEVGELPLEVQPRLLRVLEARQIKRVGGDGYRTVDVRVVAATHRSLEHELEGRRFREDLYHRLAVVTVTLPPLRERPEDIPFLIDEMLRAAGRDSSALSPQTRALLAGHSWPGNVRELRNVVERAVSLGGEAALPVGPRAAGGKTVSGISASRPFKEAKDDLVNAFERDYVADLLARCGGNVSQAARDAGIDRAYLHRLIKKHHLDAD